MATQALAKQDEGGNEVAKLSHQLSVRADQFRMVLPSHITPERFQRTILTAVQSDPDLLLADRQSLVLACMKAAQDGLLPDKREAALVIFTENKKVGSGWEKTKKVQYMPMVYGLRKKVLQSGEIADITAKVVYRREVEEGFFVYEEGTEAMLRHKPMLDLAAEDATDDCIVAAYSMATFKDGEKSYEVMRRFEIDKVRQASQTGAVGKVVQFGNDKGKEIKPKGPWVDWFPEQAKKTVIRRHTKTLPMSGDLVDVEAMDDRLAAESTTSLLGSVKADAPELTDTAPPRRLQAVDHEDQPHDEETGEIKTDEEVARDLDRQSVVAMEGRTDEQHGDQHDGGGETPSDMEIAARDLIARYKKVEIKRDHTALTDDFNAMADALPDDLYNELKEARETAAARFNTTEKGAAK